MIYLNNKPVNTTLFPDNTSQVWKLTQPILNENTIKWDFLHEGEFMQLAQLKHLLDKYPGSTALELPYLPYGRQDKEVSNESTFALRTFANLLNSLNFDMVTIDDPHSEVACQIIHNSYPIYNLLKTSKVIDETESTVLCYPDKGAFSKYKSMYGYPYIYGEKIRDQLTGNITSYDLVGDPKDKKILIIDDICDGGMTFKLLAQELLKKGAKEVNLFVSHGIFSKGLRVLHEAGIKRVYTKDGEVSQTQNGFTYRRL